MSCINTNKECNHTETCCEDKNTGIGPLIMVVVFILLIIILGAWIY